MDESKYKNKVSMLTQDQLPFNNLHNDYLRQEKETSCKGVIDFNAARKNKGKEKHNDLVRRVVDKAIERVKWLDSNYDE